MIPLYMPPSMSLFLQRIFNPFSPKRQNNRRQEDHYVKLFDYLLSRDGVHLSLEKNDILIDLLRGYNTAELLKSILESNPGLDVNLVEPSTGNGMLHMIAEQGNNETLQV